MYPKILNAHQREEAPIMASITRPPTAVPHLLRRLVEPLSGEQERFYERPVPGTSPRSARATASVQAEAPGGRTSCLSSGVRFSEKIVIAW